MLTRLEVYEETTVLVAEPASVTMDKVIELALTITVLVADNVSAMLGELALVTAVLAVDSVSVRFESLENLEELDVVDKEVLVFEYGAIDVVKVVPAIDIELL